MRVNVNHPSFITFLDNVTTEILSNVKVEKYFDLSSEKKLAVQYMVLNLMKGSIKLRSKLSEQELRGFVSVLWKKNEESENYEFAAVLNDITSNFDSVNEYTKTPKRTTKTIKVDQTNNG